MISVKVKGLDKVLKGIDQKSKEIQKSIGWEMQDGAEQMANGAVLDAPTDQGLLKNGISSKKVDDLNFEVVSQVGYSPFIEFGTRSKVRIPPGLEKIAAQYRSGKKGTAEEAKKAIYEWCRRKGIEEKSWYPIYRSIMVNGIDPQPFFFKQVEKFRKVIINNAKNALK